MKVLRGVAVGDLHLDVMARYYSDPAHALNLQMDSLRRVAEHAVANHIPHLFQLGDIGHGFKDHTKRLRMSEEAQIAMLRFCKDYDGKLNLWFIAGNHDYTGLESNTIQTIKYAATFLNTVKFFDTKEVVSIDGVPVAFLPFPFTKAPQNSLAVAHYEAYGAIGDNGMRLKSEHLSKHDYPGRIFLQGHLHTPQKVRQHHYAGTLYQTSFGEGLEKKYIEFQASYSTKRGIQATIDWKPFQSKIKLVNLVVSKKSDLLAVRKALQDEPDTRFKLFIDEAVKFEEEDIPSNVFNRLSFSAQGELEELQHAELILETQDVNTSTDVELNCILKAEGLSPKQIKRCYTLIEKAKAKLR